ncbi:Myosin-1 [Frankliniella fusca]|uniref:Myosin-1 n=1 Tax=Frankliniella fusca TaxID=407009 RepID=A0AAE1H971_9NEOP|nr:Myosin-1 [Frankliniella fusca]
MEECIEMCEMYQKWIGNGENENTVYAIGPTNLKLKKPGFMSGVFLSMKGPSKANREAKSSVCAALESSRNNQQCAGPSKVSSLENDSASAERNRSQVNSFDKDGLAAAIV